MALIATKYWHDPDQGIATLYDKKAGHIKARLPCLAGVIPKTGALSAPGG